MIAVKSLYYIDLRKIQIIEEILRKYFQGTCLTIKIMGEKKTFLLCQYKYYKIRKRSPCFNVVSIVLNGGT